MDLFAIERFDRNDSKPILDISASKSSNLQRLLDKIEEKKQLKSQKKEVDLEQILNKKKNKRPDDQHDEFIGERKRWKGEEIQENSVLENTEKREDGEENVEEEEENLALENHFTILGEDFKGHRGSKVAKVLPYWMQNPTIVSSSLVDLTVGVHDLPQLSGDLIEKLEQKGITHFFPVQHAVIPWLLESQNKPAQFWPRDVCVCVPTGSGKTLAFVLPIIQALKNRFVPHIRALIVVHTKELASQIWEVFSEYSKTTDLHVVCLNAQELLKDEQEQLVYYSEVENKYCSCADIVITTPGRLVDHLQATPGFILHHLKYLVIDEADRVIKEMQNDWLYQLEKHLVSVDMQKVPPLTVRELNTRQPPPQKLLFSATLTSDPETIQKLGLFRPILFTYQATSTDDSYKQVLTTPAELSEYWVSCELSMKPLALYHIISEGNWKTVLVFVNLLGNVHKLTLLLQKMFSGHGNKSVSEVSSKSKRRQKTFQSFASGNINILVTTDALARGVDIPSLDCVICYDTNEDLRTYIHRVGRAGRAGRTGTAVTLVEQGAEKDFKKIIRRSPAVYQKIEEKIVDAATLQACESIYHEALEAVKEILKCERTQVVKKMRKTFTSKKTVKSDKQKSLIEEEQTTKE